MNGEIPEVKIKKKKKKGVVFSIMDCHEAISSIPDHFMQNHEGGEGGEYSAFATICVGSSKALHGEEVRSFAHKFTRHKFCPCSLSY